MGGINRGWQFDKKQLLAMIFSMGNARVPVFTNGSGNTLCSAQILALPNAKSERNNCHNGFPATVE
ncbi:hypothetical protein ACOTTU_23230 [Roseobacter sp. EG26]|uniref:hypothetical protein n=1 Tax=Roseobacter sp. EG26 TaxID=3412477 RepID=UPI003CE49148